LNFCLHILLQYTFNVCLNTSIQNTFNFCLYCTFRFIQAIGKIHSTCLG
jgi:hypothetical protein